MNNQLISQYKNHVRPQKSQSAMENRYNVSQNSYELRSYKNSVDLLKATS